jgi:hypothetical protein
VFKQVAIEVIVKFFDDYFETNQIKIALPKEKQKAPMIPSVVFLGEILWAKGLFPKSFPNIRPPLSAYQTNEKIRVKNFTLIINNKVDWLIYCLK